MAWENQRSCLTQATRRDRTHVQDEFADRWVLEAFQPVGITNSGQLIRLIKLDLHQGREARALSAVRRRMLACCCSAGDWFDGG